MGTRWLVVAGALSAAASLMHLAIIVRGPDWYRFFGAGEEMARAAARGSPVPALMTSAIAAVLAIWALYAFSAAGLVRRLPLLRTALIAIAAIYLARGLILVPLVVLRPELVDTFAVVSSLVVLGYGIAYGVGTWKNWDRLRPGSAARPG